jgi:hypothetical protein
LSIIYTGAGIVSKFDTKNHQLKRAEDNLKLARLQNEVAEQQLVIANAKGFGAKRKIRKAEAALTKLMAQINALTAQMRLEDAQMEAELLKVEERKRQAIEAEERWKRQAAQRAKRAEQDKIEKAQREQERQEAQRLRAEWLASLTPEERLAEEKRQIRVLRNLRIAVLIILFLFIARILLPSRDLLSESTPSVALTPAATMAKSFDGPSESTSVPSTSTNTPLPTHTPVPTDTPVIVPTSTPSRPTLEQSFAGKTVFTYAAVENIEFSPIDLDTFLSDKIIFRFHYTEGNTPADLYQDICPNGYSTVWYAFEAEGNGPVSFGFSMEIKPDLESRSTWFLPIFMDEYREAAGNPTFQPPVYFTYCTDPQYWHSHTVFVDNEHSASSDRNLRCKIVIVDDDGHQQILDENTSNGFTAMCWHTDN